MKNVNIVGKYKIWFSLSGAVILIGIILMLVRGLNFGIDFTGGTMMQIQMNEMVATDEIRTTLESFNLDPEIVHFGDDQSGVIIKTKESLSNAQRDEIVTALDTAYGLPDNALLSSEQFGPAVGSEIRNRAIIAIAIASVVMLGYISFRFEAVFGIAAIIALLHDIMVLLSVYAIFSLSVNSSFIAAILTIVGYSINDTIVVFDRIRENVKREKRMTHGEIADLSIGQTLSRTINTSMTTLIVIGALYVLGLTSIREFALPLLVGVIVGTYSSIFIASPVWSLVRSKMRMKNAYAAK
jgi:preprotein translocase subunit SecF